MSLSAEELKLSLAEHQVAEAGLLHEIATEDVSISIEAMAAIKKAATEILARFVPNHELSRLTMSDIMRMFAEKLFWNEETGGLLMCSEMGEGAFCLPIPREHWEVSHTGYLH